ncbi:dTMP kinase [Nonomuraea turkmeniaca]|uniref:Thymidylate kinase n=1 Tax=Nonomuraea turkmeniaca TaxID=103838 RepID=A0A5S4FJ19_9ACTN|nr:dTMP kinase [Nonomuraea turkmeniaca]TMR20728.1 dTMP kinase [Nonomuraea turkmeniaca]
MSRRGYFVAVCGIDGSGKTTQLETVANYLSSEGEVVRTRQPSDLYRGDPAVRAMLDMADPGPLAVPELAVFAAFDRLRHIRTTVLPALERGASVVTDRYVYSTYSYFLARGVDDLGWLMELNRYAPEPDLTLYLDVPTDVAAKRIIARDGSSRKREELDLDRMDRVRHNFRTQPWGASPRYVTIDGTQALESVRDQVIGALREHDPRRTQLTA